MLLTGFSVQAQSSDPSLPHILRKDGRYALMVDNAPYLMLGAQVNNSSGWPAMLPKVWPAMEFLHVNTVEIPIYWEQFEPHQGHFDYSVIDTILTEAREHKFHLVFLWFATWKNGSAHYLPQWMKLQPQRYPNMIGPDGKYVDSPSPFAQETLAADAKAFTAFMSHLKEVDAQHTVLMVQVENESGTWQCPRDYSPEAQKAFESPVPAEALAAMQKSAQPNSNWTEVFGKDAEPFFHAWFVAKYIGQVAAAGKAVYPIPLYANAAVREPTTPPPQRYEFGGPTDNVFPLWKTAAPAIDILSPDIYQRDTARYLKLLDLYNRPDNPLFVPETIGQGPLTRMLYAAIGRGAIGYSPFGLDYTRTPPSGTSPEESLEATAQNYRIIGPMARDIARLNFEGKIQTAVEGETASSSQSSQDDPAQTLHFGPWDADIFFGTFARNRPTTRPQSAENVGRVLIAQLQSNQFLITGLDTRIAFRPTGDNADRPWQYLIVEEGNYENDVFNPQRILNGDQTDWGLFVGSTPTVLRVTLYMR
jgi:hypothetical protein